MKTSIGIGKERFSGIVKILLIFYLEFGLDFYRSDRSDKQSIQKSSYDKYRRNDC